VLSETLTAYYFKVPWWAKRADCPLRNEALGTDYGEAKRRCDSASAGLLAPWLLLASVVSFIR
jgi:hypothetical protein